MVLVILSLEPDKISAPASAIEEVEWGIMEDILTAYFCTGNEDWFEDYQPHRSTEKHLQIMVSVQNILFCNRLPIYKLTSVYSNSFRPLLQKDECARKCYRDAISLIFMRSSCCSDLIPSISSFVKDIYTEMKCYGNLRGHACTFAGYMRRHDVIAQAYHLVYCLQMCHTCNRNSFNSSEDCTSTSPGQLKLSRYQTPSRRSRRFYDIPSWIYALKGIAELNINNMTLRGTDPGVYLRRNMFIGEGMIKCTLKLSV